MSIILFISPSYLKQKTLINGVTDSDKIAYLIQTTQEIKIQELLGTNLYNRLQDGFENNNLMDSEKLLINSYINPCLVHYSCSEYLRIGAYNVANAGITKHQPEGTTAVSKNEVDSIVQNERDKGIYFADKLLKFLCENVNDYPLFRSSNNFIKSIQTTNFSGGIFL